MKSSTRDVRNLILDFKKKGNLDGLVMDLRSNGGGSLQEAVSLTGLFIRTGPVVQVRNSKGKVDVYRDRDPEIFYDGPLIVMTNRLSASASEIFSGAIKDYKRGIIVGDSKTHGKGTVQTMADLNDYLRYIGVKFPAGSIKMTNAKFYRINGSSTQLKGVAPHIAFPTFSDTLDVGEEKLDNPMGWDAISPVPHSQYAGQRYPEALEKLRELSDKRISVDPGFRILKQNIEYLRKNKENKTVSLNFKNRWEKYLREKDIYDEQSKLLHLDPESETKENRKKDLYLDETIRIMGDYIRLLKSSSQNARIQDDGRNS